MKQTIRTPLKRRTGYTIGRAGFAKISAVEGIHLTKTMNDDLSEFEREDLSPEERRRIIAEKYGKVR
jgi:hypothetical protein